MIIKASSVMRNDYNLISDYANKKGEIVFLTKHGQGDLVVMSISTFEKREEQLALYNTIMRAEKSRESNLKKIFTCNEVLDRLKAKFIE